MHVSRDEGKSWEHRDGGLTQRDVYCLRSVRLNGKVKVYVGTEPAHLFESDDLGASWKELPGIRSVGSVPKWHFPPPPHEAHVKTLTVDPADSQVIYACIEQGGLIKSEDGGKSWRDLEGFVDEDCHRVVLKPSDSKWVYLVTRMGLSQSRDGGESWERLTEPEMGVVYPDAFLIHPKREELMFMGGAGARPPFWHEMKAAKARIGRSRDGGRSWELLEGGLPQPLHGNVEAMAMEVWDGSDGVVCGDDGWGGLLEWG